MSNAAERTLTERWRAWVRRIVLLPARYDVQAATEPPADGKLCFVLETDRRENQWVLDDLCIQRGWRRPEPGFPRRADCGVWTLRRSRRWFARKALPRGISELSALFAPQDLISSGTVLVPVAVYWGRAPAREHSLIKLALSEGWARIGRIRRLFAVLVHGRDVLIKVGQPIRTDEFADPDMDKHRHERKLGRVLRVFFQQQRTATVGPDLSHRRLLLDEVLASSIVIESIRREVRSTAGAKERKVRARAHRYANEIAADYSYPVVRAVDRCLAWLWNKLYEGVDVRHLDGLAAIPSDSEIVYVPCHRSHIDYMLLAFVIFREGYATPHTAAGVNLNLPIVGRILRRGGAFFIRRSFQGNALYAAVFKAYFRKILMQGFPIKYFIEGGRSRTGRLLKPKLGLLAMTIEGYLADSSRPVIFVPVYFGYEKLLEGQALLGELLGKNKKQETLTGFLRSLKALRGRFGSVQVSFAEPIKLGEVLDLAHPTWPQEKLAEPFRPEWVSNAAEALGDKIMISINEAAVINAVNLVSLVMLSMPKQALVEIELKEQIELYMSLAKAAPYSSRVGQSALTAQNMIQQCEEMDWLVRHKHELGDVLRMDERSAVLASYYRNNIVHLFVLPALLAAGFNNRPELSWRVMRELVAKLYACLRAELYLRLEPAQLDSELSKLAETMLELGLLEANAGALSRPSMATKRGAQLRLCAQIVQPIFERYYLSITVLLSRGSKGTRRAEFLSRCSEAAEQLSLIYSTNSPDLSQSGLFDNLLTYLFNAGIAEETSGGALAFDTERLTDLATALGFVLAPQIRQTLVNLAGLAADIPSRHSAG